MVFFGPDGISIYKFGPALGSLYRRVGVVFRLYFLYVRVCADFFYQMQRTSLSFLKEFDIKTFYVVTFFLDTWITPSTFLKSWVSQYRRAGERERVKKFYKSKREPLRTSRNGVFTDELGIYRQGGGSLYRGEQESFYRRACGESIWSRERERT